MILHCVLSDRGLCVVNVDIQRISCYGRDVDELLKTSRHERKMMTWSGDDDTASMLTHLVVPSSSPLTLKYKLSIVFLLKPYKNSLQQHRQLGVILTGIVCWWVYFICDGWDQFKLTVQSVWPPLCWALPCPHPPRHQHSRVPQSQQVPPVSSAPSTSATPFKHRHNNQIQIPFQHNHKYTWACNNKH